MFECCYKNGPKTENSNSEMSDQDGIDQKIQSAFSDEDFARMDIVYHQKEKLSKKKSETNKIALEEIIQLPDKLFNHCTINNTDNKMDFTSSVENIDNTDDFFQEEKRQSVIQNNKISINKDTQHSISKFFKAKKHSESDDLDEKKNSDNVLHVKKIFRTV